MPELPEVETIRRDLLRSIVRKRITDVLVLDRRLIKHPANPGKFKRLVCGRGIERLARRGKYLIAHLDDGSQLVMHLCMTGQLRLGHHRHVLDHERVRFDLSCGETLSFVDRRALGKLLHVGRDEHHGTLKSLENMGPELGGNSFSAAFLSAKLRGRKARIKSLLLKQQICCGVGNIYSDEALFRARIRPTRFGGSLTNLEVERLATALKDVLAAGVKEHGTTLGDNGYLRPDGSKGSFQKHLKVYGREREKCDCGEVIRKVSKRFGMQSTRFCPVCQK